jgi:predicted PurR-regulated permease PerM
MLTPLARTFLAVGLAFLVIATLRLAAGVLVPVVQALIVFFVLNALTDGVRRLPVVGKHASRSVVLIVMALAAFAIGFVVVESSVRAIGALGPGASGFREALNPLVDRIGGTFGITDRELNQAVDGLGLETLLRQVVAGTIATISHFGVVAIYVAFLLVDQQFFEAKLRVLAPDPERQRRIRALLERIAGSIKKYLWVMTLTSALTTVLSYAVMRFVGVEYAGFWATAIFFLNFIPTIGSILGTVLPAVFALLQFQELWPVLMTLAGIGAVQVVVGNILMPHMAGSTLNISLFVTILSLFSWGALWGVTGMFVAMPLTAIMIIVFSNFDATRRIAVILSRNGDVGVPPGPPEDAPPAGEPDHSSATGPRPARIG